MDEEPKIPVVDLFAGPGGLGEGFARAFCPSRSPFKVVLSVECDANAHRTLELRSFYRQFDDGPLPEDYFSYLRGERDRQSLAASCPKEWQAASQVAYRAELGKVPAAEVDRRIEQALKGHPPDWVLMGGPPCQAYSLVGRARKGRRRNAKDHRHFLYQEYLRILREHRPTAFVMENVKGLLSAKVRENRIVEHIIADLGEAGYRLYALQPGKQNTLPVLDPQPADFLVECERYGIPQARHRLIIVGVRYGRPLNGAMQLLPAQLVRTVAHGLRGIPPLRSKLSRRAGADSGTAWAEAIHKAFSRSTLAEMKLLRGGEALITVVQKALAELQYTRDNGADFLPYKMRSPEKDDPLWNWYVAPRLRGVCNHETRSHIAMDLARYLYAACYAKVNGVSPDLHCFPRSLLPAHRNAQEENGQIAFADRFRVQVFNRPSTTVVAHISKDGHYFIHPDPRQCRSLTVREAARLQTFPDDYFFEGPRTEQYRQVGNAVPPLLAKQIAEALYSAVFAGPGTEPIHGGQNKQAAPQLEHGAHPVTQH
jgi:DNA (cytosine-5)-methyltransferase 1